MLYAYLRTSRTFCTIETHTNYFKCRSSFFVYLHIHIKVYCKINASLLAPKGLLYTTWLVLGNTYFNLIHHDDLCPTGSNVKLKTTFYTSDAWCLHTYAPLQSFQCT